ncbi:MAG TPA: hypothetical protein VGK99_01085 [Acidobacteriota bacterium]
MRRAFVSFLVVTFSIFCHVIGQSTPTAQKLVDDVVAKYGGKALDATNFRLNGVASTAKGVFPFTVTVQQRKVRAETVRNDTTITEISSDRYGQIIEGSKRGYPDQLPVFTSSINICPILTLLHFSKDARFSASTAAAPSSLTALRFTEGNNVNDSTASQDFHKEMEKYCH